MDGMLTNTFIKKILTRDSISTFGCWIGKYKFDGICSESHINAKVLKLNSLLQEKFHVCFPTEVITVTDTDKPWITSNHRDLIKTNCHLRSNSDSVVSPKLRSYVVKLNRRVKRQYMKDKIMPLLTAVPHKWHLSVKKTRC